MHSVLRRALALAAGVLLLAGCAADSAPDGSDASSSGGMATIQVPAGGSTSDGVLCIGYTEADGFNPYLVNSSLVAQNAGLVFENLVEITPEMDLEYRLPRAS